MNITKKEILIVMLGFAPGLAHADDIAASWLQIPTSTRQAALSGAVGAMVDDVDALG